ncbi:hypothetical protein HOA93_06545 [bacterium]|nr:hypothetical protein [bacterium]
MYVICDLSKFQVLVSFKIEANHFIIVSGVLSSCHVIQIISSFITSAFCNCSYDFLSNSFVS